VSPDPARPDTERRARFWIPEAPSPWKGSDPLSTRAALTVGCCLLIVVLPLGPYRFALAATVLLVQSVATLVVSRRQLGREREMGVFHAGIAVAQRHHDGRPTRHLQVYQGLAVYLPTVARSAAGRDRAGVSTSR
jgi:hypothetical protein